MRPKVNHDLKLWSSNMMHSIKVEFTCFVLRRVRLLQSGRVHLLWIVKLARVGDVMSRRNVGFMLAGTPEHQSSPPALVIRRRECRGGSRGQETCPRMGLRAGERGSLDLHHQPTREHRVELSELTEVGDRRRAWEPFLRRSRGVSTTKCMWHCATSGLQ
jgi:hypothetical protein